VSRVNLRRLLVLFALLSLVRGMLYAALIPPWQGPDEPKHFEYVRILHEKRRPVSWADINPSLEREILSSLDRYRFWEKGYYESLVGNTFIEVFGPGSHNLEQPLLGFLPYAAILDLFPLKDTALQLYAMRVVAALIGAMSTVVAWFTVVELFPNNWPYVVGIMSFIVFLPMHSFMLGMLNSDHMAELFAYLTFFVLVRILHRGATLGRVLAVVIVALLGAFAKRTYLLAVPAIVAAIPLYLWGRQVTVRLTWRAIGAILVSLSLASGIGVVLVLQEQTIFVRVITVLQKTLKHVYTYYLFLPSEQFPFDYSKPFFSWEALRVYRGFYVLMYRSFWGWFGWLKVPLSPWLYVLLGLVSITACLGLLLLTVRARRGELDLEFWQRKALVLFALSIVGALLMITAREIRSWALWGGGYPQGRFLFPVLIPIASLFFIGLLTLVPVQYRKPFTLGYVLTFAVFDTYALTGYILPFFYG